MSTLSYFFCLIHNYIFLWLTFSLQVVLLCGYYIKFTSWTYLSGQIMVSPLLIIPFIFFYRFIFILFCILDFWLFIFLWCLRVIILLPISFLPFCRYIDALEHVSMYHTPRYCFLSIFIMILGWIDIDICHFFSLYFCALVNNPISLYLLKMLVKLIIIITW